MTPLSSSRLGQAPRVCGPVSAPGSCCLPVRPLQPLSMAGGDPPVCCGAEPAPPASPHERPGYTLCAFVEGFVETPVGPVPRLAVGLTWLDRLGTVRARLGIARDRYRVAPGLYCVGEAGPDSPVLATANYKLSLDALRRELGGRPAWILLLDTRGINVWCAAGKGTFGTEELVRRVKSARLDQVVRHRRIVLPQLAAPGVSAIQVRRGCGFEVAWGPIRARDVGAYLDDPGRETPAMRRLTFTLAERLVLVPVEISLVLRPLLWTALGLLILSGIGPDVFALSRAWQRMWVGLAAVLAGVGAGALLVPAFLPWLPGRLFAAKGLLTGLLAGLGLLVPLSGGGAWSEGAALVLVCSAISSYTAMTFTGATPFTSPSGVEWEMRRAIPLQVFMALAALCGWVAAPFLTRGG